MIFSKHFYKNWFEVDDFIIMTSAICLKNHDIFNDVIGGPNFEHISLFFETES